MNIGQLPCKVIGLTNAEYHSLREFDGRSFFKSVEQNDGEAQLWMDKGRSLWNGNSATKKGSEFDAVVTGMLAGKTFDDMCVVPPDEVLDARGARSGHKYKDWADEQTGVICTADQRWQFRLMVDNMLGHNAVYDLWHQTNETQVSVFFELHGHKCKVRPDACCPDRWWDLKTTSQPWSKLFYSARDYGYDLQEALYVSGAVALGMDPFRMPFVFVQTVPPYGCRAFYLPEEMVANAQQRLNSVIEQVRLRRSTGMYMPAEANEIVELEVPRWALKKEEEVVL